MDDSLLKMKWHGAFRREVIAHQETKERYDRLLKNYQSLLVSEAHQKRMYDNLLLDFQALHSSGVDNPLAATENAVQ